MKRYPKDIFLLVLFIIFINNSTFSASGQTQYTLPNIINLSLKDLSSENSENKTVKQLLGSIASNLGRLTSIAYFFESSPDLSLIECPQKIISIDQAASITFFVKFTTSEKPPSEIGSWVKLVVRYKPDYEKLLQYVTENVSLYPIEYERNRLLEEIKKNEASFPIQTEGFRLFLRGKNSPSSPNSCLKGSKN
ncbi:MAG: hypothetical protein HQM08_24730 [Candidatus Riflebacteria bacterium]|nr:hypothetical protein [Candidatus Riflebacteria bacterium]